MATVALSVRVTSEKGRYVTWRIRDEHEDDENAVPDDGNNESRKRHVVDVAT
jgi:hypothetical protein